MSNHFTIPSNEMGVQSTFFRAYATPLKVNGAFLTIIMVCFTALLLSFQGGDRYGWVYPLLAALAMTIAAIVTNTVLAIRLCAKGQHSMATAYAIAVVPYLVVFFFFWSVAGQMHIGKLEGG